MRRPPHIHLLILTLLLGAVSHLRAQAPENEATLRIATVNVWSGLDYVGAVSMGEWESEERRDVRFERLVDELRREDPDVVLLQEGSPIARVASRIASALDFDEIHQVVNAGLKLGSLGLPSNLKEGTAILARKSLRLEEVRTWKLSGSFGLHGDVLSLHTDRSILATAARIRVGSRPIHIVNVHLSATAPIDDSLHAELERMRAAGAISKREIDEGLAAIADEQRLRREEIDALLEGLQALDPRIPVVVAGDFNATIASGDLSALIDSAGYRSAIDAVTGSRPTWDPVGNENVAFSTRLSDASGARYDPEGVVSAVYDRRARAIDHIFLGTHFAPGATRGSRLFLDEPKIDSSGARVHASDHYGVIAEIDLRAIGPDALLISDERIDAGDPTVDALPIATYDTDAGFGYGAKGYLRNLLGDAESFDVTLFNSTEGERWYRLVVSWPDVELRHRKLYPLALDLEIDYDKWINNSYFGVGNASRFAERRYYTREPLDVALSASRALSTSAVAQLGVRYRAVRNFDLRDSALWSGADSALLLGRESWGSIFASLRSDTRNSTVNPTRGSVLQADVEIAPSFAGTTSFTRLGASVQSYVRLWYPTTVLALRAAARGLIGPDIPVHALLSLGGNNTLRGSPQDRYLDRILFIANAELRFPIYWRFGGVVGYDAGKVWREPAAIDVRDWPGNAVVGLRFSMDTFVARLDVGLGRDVTGVYFNFGQAF